MKAADRLADTMLALFALRPWEGKKLPDGNPVTVAAYFDTIRGGFDLPTDARRMIVDALANHGNAMVANVCGASTRTVCRDRDALGIANETRQDAQRDVKLTVKREAVAEMEAAVMRLITAGTEVGVTLGSVLVELYVARAWEYHGQSIADYFMLTLGVGELGFTLPKRARREVVKLMAAQVPDAPISHIVYLTGSATSTINKDRANLNVANPNRRFSQKAAWARRRSDETVGEISVQDVFYVVKNPSINVLKIGSTSGDGVQRLRAHRAYGYSSVLFFMDGFPEARVLEEKILVELSRAEIAPLWGREFFSSDVCVSKIVFGLCRDWSVFHGDNGIGLDVSRLRHPRKRARLRVVVSPRRGRRHPPRRRPRP
jgi:hypothetical protein